MATTYRFPVLVWQTAAGQFTASVLECDEFAAVGHSVREALEQLRDLLEWRYRQESWRDPPDYIDPELVTFKIAVRPEYPDHGHHRRFPLPETIDLRVPCVVGKQSGGMRLASLPLLGLRVNFSERDDVRSLVQRAVQRQMEGLSPREISRLIAPPQVTLDDVFASVDRQRERPPLRMETRMLQVVADPLGDPRVRSLFGRAWERDGEVHDFVKRLQADRGNWLLLGEHGCGKTTLLCEAIRHVERQLNDDEREDEDAMGRKPVRRFWQSSAGRLISGMKYLGQWEERLEEVLRELQKIDGVLCVESLLDWVRAGGAEPTNGLASFCVPYLQRGELRMIAEASPTELDACRRLLPGLLDLFQVATVPTLDSRRATAVLNQLADQGNAQRDVAVAPDAARRTIHLFQRFEPYHALPGETIPFSRDLLFRPNDDGDDGGANETISADTVTRRFLRRTGLPELFLRDERPLAREAVLAQLSREVIGQDAACDAAADVVISFKAGMNDPRRPLGVLLFCGPTGVGKTELAKTLARFLYGGETEPNDADTTPVARVAGTRLIRLDMSEYSGPWGADRLLLQANGEPSDFLLQVRRQPFTVILFDEIEKAHPDVFDVLMNVFDEGRITDRFGRVTWFRSAVVILTSNLGTSSTSSVGFDHSGSQSTSHTESAVREYFRPEFFNRIDRLVTFDSLSPAVIAAITEKELKEIASREGLRKRGLRLSWTSSVVEHFARTGFDPRYGARPLQRAIESEVVAPLSRLLIARPAGNVTEIQLVISSQDKIELTTIREFKVLNSNSASGT